MKFFALLIASVAAVNISKGDWVKQSDIDAEHKVTMDQANIWEAKRVADVAAEGQSNEWRGKGEKIAWAPNTNKN